MTELPFVDRHETVVPAPPAATWAAVERYAGRSLRIGPRHPIALLLGTEPPNGFVVAESSPPSRLALTGRHRFSRYRLVFECAAEGAGATRLSASTYAEFPGLHGRAYRALVIGSRGHAVLVRLMLRSIQKGVAAQADLT